jgi:hypothetical protein
LFVGDFKEEFSLAEPPSFGRASDLHEGVLDSDGLDVVGGILLLSEISSSQFSSSLSSSKFRPDSSSSSLY